MFAGGDQGSNVLVRCGAPQLLGDGRGEGADLGTPCRPRGRRSAGTRAGAHAPIRRHRTGRGGAGDVHGTGAFPPPPAAYRSGSPTDQPAPVLGGSAWRARGTRHPLAHCGRAHRSWRGLDPGRFCPVRRHAFRRVRFSGRFLRRPFGRSAFGRFAFGRFAFWRRPGALDEEIGDSASPSRINRTAPKASRVSVAGAAQPGRVGRRAAGRAGFLDRFLGELRGASGGSCLPTAPGSDRRSAPPYPPSSNGVGRGRAGCGSTGA